MTTTSRRAQTIRNILVTVVSAVMTMAVYQLIQLPTDAFAIAGATPSAPNCTQVVTTAPGALPMANASAGLHHQVKPTAYYTVYGNTSGEITRQMMQCGPEYGATAVAVTMSQATIGYDLSYLPGGQCRVINARVGVHTQVTLPSWQATNTADKNLQNKWQAFATAVAAHEQGHVDIDNAHGQKMLDILNAMPAENCGTIQATVAKTMQAEKRAMDTANADYDSHTDHGHTQGVKL